MKEAEERIVGTQLHLRSHLFRRTFLHGYDNIVQIFPDLPRYPRDCLLHNPVKFFLARVLSYPCSHSIISEVYNASVFCTSMTLAFSMWRGLWNAAIQEYLVVSIQNIQTLIRHTKNRTRGVLGLSVTGAINNLSQRLCMRFRYTLTTGVERLYQSLSCMKLLRGSHA